MDMLSIRITTIPHERLMESQNLDAPEDVLVYLECEPSDAALSEIENTIIDTLHELGCYRYNINASSRTLNWGAEASTGEIVAYIAPFIEAAVSGASGALAYTLIQKLFGKDSASTQSRHLDETRAVGLEACEAKAIEYLRWKFGQEAAVSLTRATETGTAGYAFEFECDNFRGEVLTGLDGYVFGFRRL